MPCLICGAKTSSSAPDEQPTDWFNRVRFVHHDLLPNPESPLRTAREPCISSVGKVIESTPFLFTDRSGSDAVILPSRLMGYKWNSGPETSCCFPVHESCWEIFCHISGKSLEEYPQTHITTLFKVFALLDQDFDFDNLDDDENARGLEDWVLDDPAGILPLDCFFEEPEYWRRLRIADLPDKAADIPDIFPLLPNEIVCRILSFLSTKDLVKLTEIKSSNRHIVPDVVWKSRFSIRADMGYLVPHSGDNSDVRNWYSLCVLGIRYRYRALPSVLCRERIWDQCITLADLVEDIITSERANIRTENEFPFMLLDDGLKSFPVYEGIPRIAVDHQFPIVVLTLPKDPDSESYLKEVDRMSMKGMITSIQAEEIAVSYIGDGEAEYISGFRFSPCGKALGLINKRRERRVSLKSKDKVAIMVAMDIEGLRDVSIGPDDGKYHWLTGRLKMSSSIAVTKRVMRPSDQGVIFSVIAISMDVCRIRRLGIYSPEFDDPSVLDENDCALQGNIWVGGLPAMDGRKSINASSYYDSRVIDIFQGHLTLSSMLKPLSFIDFEKRTVHKFTLWTLGRGNINGITLEVDSNDDDDDDEERINLTLGQSEGIAIDFPMNGQLGERIKYIEIKGNKSSGSIGSLSVFTTASRLFHICLEDLKRLDFGFPPMCAEPGYIITGLYGRHVKPISLGKSSLVSLGCISTKSEDVLAHVPIYGARHRRAIIPQNPQYAPFYSIVSRRLVPDVNMAGAFTSHASLRNCKAITGYVKPWNHNRVTGLKIDYYGITSDELFGNPKILGQTSSGESSVVLELDYMSGEHITQIQWQDRTRMQKLEDGKLEWEYGALQGIKFITSANRTLWIGGDCNQSANVIENPHLLWDFDPLNDRISVLSDISYEKHCELMWALGSVVME